MLLVSVFGEAKEAAAGGTALQDLHALGAVSLYSFAIITREPDGGGIRVRAPLSGRAGAAAPAAGAAVGALVSLLGGPATAATRTLSSGIVEAIRDLADAGLKPAFLERIGALLRPGRAGLVAEAEIDTLMRVEIRMLSLGGHMLLHADAGVQPDDAVIGEIDMFRRSLAGLRKEAGCSEDPVAARVVLRSRVEELRRATERARLLACALRREGAAKVTMLREQAASMDGEARATIEQRAGRVRTAFESRASRLSHAAEGIDLGW